MRKTFFLFFLLLSLITKAQTDSSNIQKPELYPGWSLFVPGVTHFYEHKITRGILFSGLEAGGIALGIAYDKKLQTESSTPYYNFPLLLGLQTYNVDKCHWLRNNLQLMKYYRPDFQYDAMQFNELLKAPFHPKNVFTPITGCFVLAAVAQLFFVQQDANYNFNDVDRMYFIDKYIDKNPALGIYGATSMAMSYGAGVAEEYYFRNGFMPVFDYRFGQKKGLLFSSLLFGSMHLTNLLFTDNPDYGMALLQVAEASVAGWFLGRSVQKRGYKLGPAIAAHTWYDFTLMLGSFLIDPENNFLGVSIEFKM